MNTTLSCKALLLAVMVTLFVSCKKNWVEVPVPSDMLGPEIIFNNETTATGAVMGIYSQMMRNGLIFSSCRTTMYAGLSADELSMRGIDLQIVQLRLFETNQIIPSLHDTLSLRFWGTAYNLIYHANRCLEELEKSTGISQSLKTTLMGESYFARAFCYFQLVNLFGNVPLCIVTDYEITSKLGRAPVEQVYQRMIDDLEIAQNSLPDNYYSNNKFTKIRPTKWAAKALLARIYLYRENWLKAEELSNEVINSPNHSLALRPDQVFSDTAESIWNLLPVLPGYNTFEGFWMIPVGSNIAPNFLIRNDLLNAFEPGDLRRQYWIGERQADNTLYYYPAKYKIRGSFSLDEMYIVLRLAEQYLIRAEARAHQNKLDEATTDINTIRERSALPHISTGTQQETLLAIEKERRIEFMVEWGHRWYDLKRTGRANAVLGTLKPNTWRSTDQLWPIPQDQLKYNTFLTQNPGY